MIGNEFTNNNDEEVVGDNQYVFCSVFGLHY
jgi:hypothetical protein